MTVVSAGRTVTQEHDAAARFVLPHRDDVERIAELIADFRMIINSAELNRIVERSQLISRARHARQIQRRHNRCLCDRSHLVPSRQNLTDGTQIIVVNPVDLEPLRDLFVQLSNQSYHIHQLQGNVMEHHFVTIVMILPMIQPMPMTTAMPITPPGYMIKLYRKMKPKS